MPVSDFVSIQRDLKLESLWTEKSINNLISFFFISRANEFGLISSFLYDKIIPHPQQTSFEIVTMGEVPFDQTYWVDIHRNLRFGKYIEKSQICNGSLQEHLRSSISKMAYRSKRPDPSNIKEVQLFDNF